MTHFNHTTINYCPHNAIELARASQLVYSSITDKHRAEFEAQLSKWSFDRYHCFGFNQDDNEEDTQAFLAGNDKVLVLCFRGTDKLEDWITNLQRDLESVSEYKGQVHRGFHKGLRSVWQAIVKALKIARDNHQPLLVTGHSLGGALATLAVARLLTEEHGLDNLQINGLYTFGSPRVGDEVFAADFNEQFGKRTFRFVNNLDIVTQLAWHSKGYRHVGLRVYAQGRNPFTLEESTEDIQVKKWIYGMFLELKLKGIISSLINFIMGIDNYIADHYIAAYIQLLEKTINPHEIIDEVGIFQQLYAQYTALLVNVATTAYCMKHEVDKKSRKTESA